LTLRVQVTSPNGELNISNISYQTPEPGTLVMLGRNCWPWVEYFATAFEANKYYR
jgi:hypothetical protein